MMGKDDTLIMKAEDNGDTLTMMFENPKTETIADFGEYNKQSVIQCFYLYHSLK